MAFKMKGMKFYGDRTRKEMRQDIKEHRKSLGTTKKLLKLIVNTSEVVKKNYVAKN
tara:strand:+ start:335 stop:502 length:168 start_codon:yes stop_codon:yes gene_type:complete